MLGKIYLISGIILVLLYALAGIYGWEIGTPKREVLPSSVRQSPGGYRSFHFWHSGFQGGK